MNDAGLRALIGQTPPRKTWREAFAGLTPELLVIGLATGIVAGFSIAIGNALAAKYILRRKGG